MYFSVLIVVLYVIYWIIQNWKLIKLDIREPIEYPMGIRQTFSVYKLSICNSEGIKTDQSTVV